MVGGPLVRVHELSYGWTDGRGTPDGAGLLVERRRGGASQRGGGDERRRLVRGLAPTRRRRAGGRRRTLGFLGSGLGGSGAVLLLLLLLAALGATVLEPHLNPGLRKVDLERDLFAHENVRVAGLAEQRL